MSTDALLTPAAAGDSIEAAQLQATIDSLRAMATNLDPTLQNCDDLALLQQTGRAQEQLCSQAARLVDVQIMLTAGQARVTAGHINAAVAAASAEIERTADLKKRLTRIGQLLDFVAVMETGSGIKMVQAAVTLKNQLSSA